MYIYLINNSIADFSDSNLFLIESDFKPAPSKSFLLGTLARGGDKYLCTALDSVLKSLLFLYCAQIVGIL